VHKLTHCAPSIERKFVPHLSLRLLHVLNSFLSGVRKTTAKGESVMYDLEKKINEAVFPGLQGGPHDNVIAGLNHLLCSLTFLHLNSFYCLCSSCCSYHHTSRPDVNLYNYFH